MSAADNAISRAERRLLLVDTVDRLVRGDSFDVRFIGEDSDAKMRDHLAMHRRPRQEVLMGENQLLRSVGSTRVRTRMAPFPRTKPHSLVGDDGSGRDASSATSPSSSPLPRLMAVHRFVEMLSPYECFACPTLLSSPLLSPLLEDPRGPTVALVCGVAQRAVRYSIPVQEALLLCSLSLCYLEVMAVCGLGSAEEEMRMLGTGGESAQPPRAEMGSTFHDLRQRVKSCVLRWMRASPNAAVANLSTEEMGSILHGTDTTPHNLGCVVDILVLAAREWESRRSATVTAASPSGSAAVALAWRDAEARAAKDGIVFAPLEERCAPASRHPFHLPPLPQDPLLLIFVPVWESVLQACMREATGPRRVRELLLQASNQAVEHIMNLEENRLRDDASAPSCLTRCIASSSFAVWRPVTGEWQIDQASGSLLFCGHLARCTSRTDCRSPHTSSSSLSCELKEVARAAEMVCSKEELADLICRLGVSLMGPASPPLTLSRALAQFATHVLQREYFDVYIECKKHGIVAWSIRAVDPRTVVLSITDNSGRERKIGSAAQLAGRAYVVDEATRGEENGRTYSLTSLNTLVTQGGYEEIGALVQHLQARSTGNTRTIALNAPQRHSAETEKKNEVQQQQQQQQMRVVALRRAEEAVLLRVLECHPDAPYLIGCGLGRILMAANNGSLHVQRRCGVVVPWTPRDCYTGAKLRELRTPRRSMSASSCGVPALTLPPDLREQPHRIARAQVHGMLQHYYTSIKSEVLRYYEHGGETNSSPSTSPTTTATAVAGAIPGSGAFPVRTTLFSIDRNVATFVLRHHPHYFTQLNGCGIAEIYVSAEEVSHFSSRTPSREEAAVATANGSASPLQEGEPPRSRVVPTFVIERICGTLVRAPVDECYERTPPYALLPHQVLVEAVADVADRKRTRED